MQQSFNHLLYKVFKLNSFFFLAIDNTVDLIEDFFGKANSHIQFVSNEKLSQVLNNLRLELKDEASTLRSKTDKIVQIFGHGVASTAIKHSFMDANVDPHQSHNLMARVPLTYVLITNKGVCFRYVKKEF